MHGGIEGHGSLRFGRGVLLRLEAGFWDERSCLSRRHCGCGWIEACCATLESVTTACWLDACLSVWSAFSPCRSCVVASLCWIQKWFKVVKRSELPASLKNLGGMTTESVHETYNLTIPGIILGC